MRRSRSKVFVLERCGEKDWEEFYIIGPGSEEEHNELRKTRPSYLDTYRFLSFVDEIQEDLKATTSKNSVNYKLLHDFAVWIVNER